MKPLACATCAALAVQGWVATAAEVAELRIPKSAGGIAFLPLLAMGTQNIL